MHPNGVRGIGISAPRCQSDLADLGRVLDRVEALGVETIELPIFDMDIVIAGRLRRSQLDRLKSVCQGRSVTFTAHGPLAINFFDEPFRLQRHFDVLRASMEAAAEIAARGAKH